MRISDWSSDGGSSDLPVISPEELQAQYHNLFRELLPLHCPSFEGLYSIWETHWQLKGCRGCCRARPCPRGYSRKRESAAIDVANTYTLARAAQDQKLTDRKSTRLNSSH